MTNFEEERFWPEMVDEQIEQHLSQQAEPSRTPESQTVQELQQHYAAPVHDEQQEQALSRVWQQLVRQDASLLASMSEAQTPPLPVIRANQQKRQTAPSAPLHNAHRRPRRALPGQVLAAEHKVLPMKGKSMQTNDSQWETTAATLHSIEGKQPGKSPRRSLRLLSSGIAALVVAALVLSWILVFSGIRPVSQTPSTRTGSQSIPDPTKTGLICNFTAQGPQNVQYDVAHSLSWASNTALTTTAGGLVTYDVSTCKQQVSPITRQADTAYWSPDGKRLLLSDTGQVYILDANGHVLLTHSAQPDILASSSTGFTPLAFQSGGSGANELATSRWSPNGTQVASVFLLDAATGYKSGVEIWNAHTGAHQMTLSCPSDQGDENAFGPATAWSADGTYVLGNEFDGNRTCVWNAHTGQLVTSLSTDVVRSFSPDSKSLTLLTSDRTVELYSLVTKKVTQIFHVTDASASDVAWSPDGKFLAIIGARVHILDASNRKEIATETLPATTALVALAWSPDSTMIATVSVHPDGTTRDASGHSNTTFETANGLVNVWKVK